MPVTRARVGRVGTLVVGLVSAVAMAVIIGLLVRRGRAVWQQYAGVTCECPNAKITAQLPAGQSAEAFCAAVCVPDAGAVPQQERR